MRLFLVAVFASKFAIGNSSSNGLLCNQSHLQVSVQLVALVPKYRPDVLYGMVNFCDGSRQEISERREVKLRDKIPRCAVEWRSRKSGSSAGLTLKSCSSSRTLSNW